MENACILIKGASLQSGVYRQSRCCGSNEVRNRNTQKSAKGFGLSRRMSDILKSAIFYSEIVGARRERMAHDFY